MRGTEVDLHPEAAAALTPSEFGRASLTYALGGLAYKSVALLAVPILARLLTPAELGLLDLAAIFATLIGVVVTFGTDHSIAYWEHRSEARGKVWGAAITVIAAGAVVSIAVVLTVHEPLANWLTGTATAGPTIVAAAVYGGMMAVSAITLVTVRLRGAARTFAIASFLIVAAEMSVALAIASLLEDPVTWMVIAWSIGATIVAVPLLVRHLPRLERPDVAAIRRLTAYGGPLIPMTMAWLVGDLWIRGMLSRSADLAALGEYGIGYRIASGLGLLVTGLGVAWYPYLYRSPPGDVRRRAFRLMPAAILALTGLAGVIILLAPEIIAIVAGEAYAAARHVVAPLAAAMVSLGIFVLIGGLIGSTGSTGRVGFAALAGMIVQIAAASALITSGGLPAAGIASLLGYLTAALVGLTIVRSELIGGGGSPVFAAMALAAVSLAIVPWLMDLSFAARAALAAVMAVATGALLIRSSRIVGIGS